MSWLTTRYEAVVDRLNSKLHFPWVYATGCCFHEIQNASLATYDWQRLGVDEVATHPSNANLLIIAGWINPLRAEAIKSVYEKMMKPTSVIAVGACALSGSPYALEGEQGLIQAKDIVPVDIFVAGCPPRPEAILSAVIELQRKLKPGPTTREILHEALK